MVTDTVTHSSIQDKRQKQNRPRELGRETENPREFAKRRSPEMTTRTVARNTSRAPAVYSPCARGARSSVRLQVRSCMPHADLRKVRARAGRPTHRRHVAAEPEVTVTTL